ncbi:MAG: LysE family translocator [Betaproteobacteria bacterium]
MIPLDTLLLFSAASLLLALTPGPNLLYLLSRTLCQGTRAGFVSLSGTMSGISLHMLAAAFGLSVILLAVPFAFDAIKLAGAAYLLWMAWSTVADGGGFEPRPMEPAADVTLYRQALLTGILNPKVAIFYMSLLPQFIDPARGSVLAQSLTLGTIQLLIALPVDGAWVLLAGGVTRWFAHRPLWLRTQRWVLGSAFGVLAVWLALDTRKS